MYVPVALAEAGTDRGSLRAHELTFIRAPCWIASSPRYDGHDQAAMATCTSEVKGLIPISP